METFEGTWFQSSRWDYEFTVQDLELVLDKVVGFIGTGASAVLVVPNLGRLNPVIHDVTTDPEDTLQFPPEVPTRAHERPREDVLEKQREAYPDLQPLRVTDPPSESSARVRAVAAAQPRWEVVEANEAQGLLHATATSALFGFVDDIVIRVLPEGTGSRIDVRSRSRFGEGDLGANAARVRRFLEAYQAG